MTSLRRLWPRAVGPSLGALLALAGCAKPTVPARTAGDEPDVRVGVVVRAQGVRISAQGAVAAMRGGGSEFRLIEGLAVRIEAADRTLVVSGAASGRFESLTFLSLDDRRFVEVDGVAYRGVIEVYAREGGVTAVNQVGLEAYVAGVVTAELGRRAPGEQAAVEAQAIVSRTYALDNLGKFASEGFDLRATVTDQAYGGVKAETDQAWRATRATAGTVLTQDGELISTFFHSTCGGATAAPDEAFRTARPRRYLRSVSDRRPGGYYCDISPRFRWTVEWDGAELANILRRTLPSVMGVDAEVVDAVRDVTVRRRSDAGRVTELRIRVGKGEIPVFGPDLRTVLREPAGRLLGSTAVEFTANHGNDGVIQRLTARGAGWGHGVGMCQWGAVGRARAGQDRETILTNYFPGTKLDRWY